MKFCEKCGIELQDDAAICLGCGCEVINDSLPVQTEMPKVRRKVKKIWIILSAAVLLLGVVAAVLFVPRNLKLDDI